MREYEKRLFVQQAAWIAIGVGISLAINFGTYALFGDAAFPWNIVLVIGVFMALSFFYQRRMIRKMNGGGVSGASGTDLHYQCKSCGNLYKGRFCPSCGSKGGKAVFR